MLNVLSAPYYPPPGECARARLAALPGSNPRVKLEVSVGILADSTVAVEVGISNALINWPYFDDLSLVRPARGACTQAAAASVMPRVLPLPPSCPASCLCL